MAYTTDKARWRALTIRDPHANGHFVYTVKSTGIYCRPSCAARLARRSNIGFFNTAAEAEAAGFRACKRCKPDVKYEDPQERAVNKACVLIDQALQGTKPKSFKLLDLAKSVGLTPRYFHKIFKDKTGLTPKEYAKARAQSHKESQSSFTSSGQDQKSLDTFEIDAFDILDFLDLGDFDPTIASIDPTASLTDLFGSELDPYIPSSLSNSGGSTEYLPDVNSTEHTGFQELALWPPLTFPTDFDSSIQAPLLPVTADFSHAPCVTIDSNTIVQYPTTSQ